MANHLASLSFAFCPLQARRPRRGVMMITTTNTIIERNIALGVNPIGRTHTLHLRDGNKKKGFKNTFHIYFQAEGEK